MMKGLLHVLYGRNLMFFILCSSTFALAAPQSLSAKNATGKRSLHWLYKVPDYKISWSYSGDLGPENWCKNYPSCCTRFQSPIEVGEGPGHPYDHEWDNLQFRGYDTQPESLMLENNGQTVNVYLTDSSSTTLSGGGLNGTYIFHSLHFHWGTDNTDGAEHSIYGTKFPLEMHVVHYKNNYKDLDTARASKEADAVAVLGVLFHLSSHENDALGTITRDLHRVTFPNQSYPLKRIFQLSLLMPHNTDAFFRYMGSFTVPGCEEVIAWTVFKWTLPVTPNQLAAFRSLYEDDQGTFHRQALVNNFRPLQPLNGRSVYDVQTVQVGNIQSSGSAPYR